MIKFKNTEVIENVPFQEYLSWDGYSNSFFKMEKAGVVEPLQQSAKITFGSLVDDILTNPVEANVSDPRFQMARKAATSIIQYFGEGMYEMLKKQLSMKSVMYAKNGLECNVKGRIDFLGSVVMDLKVTDEKEKNLDTLIHYLGYDNQIFFYSKMINNDLNHGFILFYLKNEERVVVKKVNFLPKMEEYFYNKLLKFGM